jgi:hypothetical protein
METEQINIEEKGCGPSQKQLTKMATAGIVKKVPRGLRNSKPPKTKRTGNGDPKLNT